MDAEIPYTRLRADASALQKNGNVRAIPGRKIDIASTEALRVWATDKFKDLRPICPVDKAYEKTAATVEALDESIPAGDRIEHGGVVRHGISPPYDI